MILNVKRLSDTAYLPTRGSACAAGYDLYSDTNAAIYPGETQRINTGIAVEIPDGHFGAIFARSGLATNMGLRPANCVGVIDSDYRGELIVALHNDSVEECREVRCGDRIAQLVIMPYMSVDINEVDELTNTDRGAGGFGSTGK